MKKILMTICLVFSLLVATLTSNAQSTTPYALSVTGGYSWLSGVVGAEIQVGQFGFSGGWMPTSMPMSGEKLNSVGFAATLYSGPPTDPSTFYASFGVASDGYRYEDSNGYGEVLPMSIIMVGSKYDSGGVFFKAGAGYGWCEIGGAFTFELTLGFSLFKNY
jgi:hypothetical protein